MIQTGIFALETRNKLRTLQAGRKNDDFRIDKTIREIILDIAWRIAEKISSEKLPR